MSLKSILIALIVPAVVVGFVTVGKVVALNDPKLIDYYKWGIHGEVCRDRAWHMFHPLERLLIARITVSGSVNGVQEGYRIAAHGPLSIRYADGYILFEDGKTEWSRKDTFTCDGTFHRFSFVGLYPVQPYR